MYNEFDYEYEWQKFIQYLADEIDLNISYKYDGELTLGFLSDKLGYSVSHTARKFKEISGIDFRDYLRLRKLSFALADLRSAKKTILDIDGLWVFIA